MAYDSTNTGMLARNERKEKPTHPDFKGSAVVGGTEYWISGWTKDGKPGSKMEGRKFFSLSFEPKQKAAYQPPKAQEAGQSSTTGALNAPSQPANEDVPF